MDDLETRVMAYRLNLMGIADQMEELAALLQQDGRDGSPLLDGVKLYRLVADDLDKVIRGEELRPFMVSGEV